MKNKNKKEWLPYKELRVGDSTDLGVVLELELNKKKFNLACGTLVTFDITRSQNKRYGNEIMYNFSRMRRQITILKTAAALAPSRKTAIRDISVFLKEKEIEPNFELPSFLDFIDDMLARYEKAVKVEKTANKFGL